MPPTAISHATTAENHRRAGVLIPANATSLAWASVLSYELDLERRQYRV